MRPDLLTAGLVILLPIGCNRQPATTGGAAPAAGPTVSVVKPEKKSVKRVVEQPGAVFPFEETVLFPKVPGFVSAVAADPNKKDRPAHDRLIDIGSRVTEGQVLAELSVPELDEEYRQKEAVVRQGEAEVVQATKAHAAAGAAVTAAEAHVSEAKAGLTRVQAAYERWKSELDRVSRLVEKGVIDAQTRDEAENQFKAAEAGRAEVLAKVTSAEAAVTKSKADRDKSGADIAAAEARRDVARADVRRVEAMREYTRIKAPFAGVVTRRGVNKGDFVTADGKSGLFAVARIDPVRVVVHVPEADAGLVAEGQEIRVALQTAPGAGETGRITRTSWSLEPGSRTLRAEIDLPNPEGKVRPGMYAYAKLTVDLPAEWSVPAAAVGKINDEPVMYLVENGKAVRVSVQLGRGDGQVTQVKKYKRAGESGWTDVTGSESVATPAAALADGQPVAGK